MISPRNAPDNTFVHEMAFSDGTATLNAPVFDGNRAFGLASQVRLPVIRLVNDVVNQLTEQFCENGTAKKP